jgi:hypothetical protein
VNGSRKLSLRSVIRGRLAEFSLRLLISHARQHIFAEAFHLFLFVEDGITGDSDEPPLIEEAVVEMLRMTHMPRGSDRSESSLIPEQERFPSLAG